MYAVGMAQGHRRWHGEGLGWDGTTKEKMGDTCRTVSKKREEKIGYDWHRHLCLAVHFSSLPGAFTLGPPSGHSDSEVSARIQHPQEDGRASFKLLPFLQKQGWVLGFQGHMLMTQGALHTGQELA